MAAVTQPAVWPKGVRDPLDERVRRRTASLDPIFNPSSVVVIADGVAPHPAAGTILSTMSKSGFAGKLFAVGLDDTASALGVESCPSVKAIPSEIDLAVVTTPANRLLDVLGQCAMAGVKGTIVTIPCRGEDGPRAELYSGVQQMLRGSRMRVLGPNCSVLMNPSLGLNVSCAAPLPVGGTIAFISQSGALCHAILEWSFRGIVGFSAFVSIGGMIDVDWGDLIDYFGADPNTRSIILFMESIGNARSFLSAAREVALNKPIIVAKAGRSDTAARIIAAHTDSAPGSDEVLDAAFRRVGVLRVNTVAELFSMADVLSKEPRPQGPRLGIVSNAAGLSALAADSVTDAGAELPPLSEQSCEQLGRLLQSRWRTENPVHVPADAHPETYAEAARIVLRDPNSDGLLLLTAPEGMMHPDKPAELLVGIENPGHKPVLTCIMGVADATESQQALARACIPTFSNVHLAARAFGYMWQYAYNLRAIYETPMRRGDPVESLTRAMAASIIATARGSGRTELTEGESKYLLGTYGIQMLETRTATGEDDAVREAKELGFPVALQMADSVITDDASLPFSLPDEESVRRAWRFLAERSGTSELSARLHPCLASNSCTLRIASRIDLQFGPVLLFGAGGQLADALNDRALALPPLNATLAERMVEETRVYRVLKAGKHARSELASLLNLIVRFSQLVIEQPWIKEVEINPVQLSRDGCVAMNARVAVYGADVAEQLLPKPAIRPYPVQYVSPWQTKRGDLVTIRPIQAEDEPLMIKFHERLSDHSVYLRYFQMIGLSQRTQHDRLTRVCFIDYDREMALVAEHRDLQTDERRIVGLGNLGRARGSNEGEVAAVVSDDYQGHGLGTELMRRLVQVARAEKMERVVGSTMLENKPTIAMLKRVGFQVRVNFKDQVVEGEINL
jgi:acetyltransferase